MPATGFGEERDVFLCHAGPDKDRYVRPLAQALNESAITYWLDQAEIAWGDSIIAKINEGLSHSRFVILFLSPAFLERNWPETELASALSLEVSTGRAVVLPLLIADEISVFNRYPLLRAKAYIRWDAGLATIVEALNRRLNRRYAEEWIFGYVPSFAGWVWARILPNPGNADRAHEYRLKWGPWQVDGILNFKHGEPICLRFGKGPDEHSYPVYLRTVPASYVQYGTGDPPCKNVVDPSGWYRV